MPAWMTTLHLYLAFLGTLFAVLITPAVWLVLTVRRVEKKLDVFMLQHKLLWLEYCEQNDIPPGQEADNVGQMLDLLRSRVWRRSADKTKGAL